MGIRIDAIELYRYKIPLKLPFRISAGVISEKEGLIVELRSGDLCGWGEASVDAVPFYAHETTGSAIDLIQRALGPAVVGSTFESPEELVLKLDSFRGGNFAKAAVEAAFWDLYGKTRGASVASLLGGVRSEVESGPSIGIKKSPDETLMHVREKLAEGWKRIKIKIAPGRDEAYLERIRGEFPDISLMADANNAYSLDDFDRIAAWDKYHLLMIEQPLDEKDIYFHSQLRKKVHTPICLDESIHTELDALAAAELGSADIINIKVCRVGGLVHARRIHDICQAAGIRNWIGSRVGSGIAEAARLAAATLPNCTLPSDCVESMMYMSDDVLVEPYVVKNGCMVQAPTPDTPGFGIEVDRAKLEKYTFERYRC